MNVRQKTAPSDTAQRILDVAEEHFRRVGYGKTAVADIAAELGMSSANVYRFFPSKLALNEAICKRLLDESHARMAAIMDEPAPAAARLQRMILDLNAFAWSKYLSERRMHDMVEVALQENWGVVRAHLDHVIACIARLITEGVASGEFRPVDDIGLTAFTFKQACSAILHPMMIAECARLGLDHEGQAERVVDFALNALKAPRQEITP